MKKISDFKAVTVIEPESLRHPAYLIFRTSDTEIYTFGLSIRDYDRISEKLERMVYDKEKKAVVEIFSTLGPLPSSEITLNPLESVPIGKTFSFKISSVDCGTIHFVARRETGLPPWQVGTRS